MFHLDVAVPSRTVLCNSPSFVLALKEPLSSLKNDSVSCRIRLSLRFLSPSVTLNIITFCFPSSAAAACAHASLIYADFIVSSFRPATLVSKELSLLVTSSRNALDPASISRSHLPLSWWTSHN